MSDHDYADDLLQKFNWDTYASQRMDGTEDWVHVASLDSDGGYDWTTLHAFYSPSARRYFWSGDSGCSCNSWRDGLDNASDFENGDRDALLRAVTSFAGEHTYSLDAADAINTHSAIRTFKEPK